MLILYFYIATYVTTAFLFPFFYLRWANRFNLINSNNVKTADIITLTFLFPIAFLVFIFQTIQVYIYPSFNRIIKNLDTTINRFINKND